MPLFYLLFGTLRGELRSPGVLGMQLAALVGFAATALAAVLLDGRLTLLVLAAGWLGHAVWDAVHHRRAEVVPRPWSQWCGVFDACGALALLPAAASTRRRPPVTTTTLPSAGSVLVSMSRPPQAAATTASKPAPTGPPTGPPTGQVRIQDVTASVTATTPTFGSGRWSARHPVPGVWTSSAGAGRGAHPRGAAARRGGTGGQVRGAEAVRSCQRAPIVPSMLS
ncbi:hypothetical protein AB0F11_30195 [Streptomyces sp. NPDC032472]|uniref:hypothetical protein n=1 Tax=Streptomyces sp. NPDC032472 TaxID=3155018 RepID=UPI0033DDBBC2